MEKEDLFKKLKENPYPGRGIVCGRTKDGKHAVIAYFIMGRSKNSRNRIFKETGDGIKTEAFIPEELEDPSLIIYSPVRTILNDTIVTNGDQTDTIYDLLQEGKTFDEALRTRQFEPDPPNYTPRISALLHIDKGSFSYEMSVLKSDEGREEGNIRNTFYYDNPFPGEGRFIHTYMGDSDVLLSFSGEPERVIIDDDIDDFTDKIWESLNYDNKVSLFTRFIEIKTGEKESRIINKNVK